MIDEITNLILQENESELIDKKLDHILEGYDLECQGCGRVITVVKDGQGRLGNEGPMSCCNKRMIVMGSNPTSPEDEEVEADIGDPTEESLSGSPPSDKLSVYDYKEPERSETFDEALASADPTEKERKEFEEGLRKILSGETVDPDFQVPIKNVDFSPDNQSDAQKKQEEKWDKEEKEMKESAFVKDIKEDYEESKKKDDVTEQDDYDYDARKAPFVNKPKGWSKLSPEKQDVMKATKASAMRYRRWPQKRHSQRRGERMSKRVHGMYGSQKRVKSHGYSENQNYIVDEAGFETKPKGWTDDSVKKFGKSLVKGGGKKEGFFDKCVEKMKDKIGNPEGFCASVKDEAYDSTYWRGKDKSPQEIGKDVKKHKNV